MSIMDGVALLFPHPWHASLDGIPACSVPLFLAQHLLNSFRDRSCKNVFLFQAALLSSLDVQWVQRGKGPAQSVSVSSGHMTIHGLGK